jgi:hypothetical protein
MGWRVAFCTVYKFGFFIAIAEHAVDLSLYIYWMSVDIMMLLLYVISAVLRVDGTKSPKHENSDSENSDSEGHIIGIMNNRNAATPAVKEVIKERQVVYLHVSPPGDDRSPKRYS